MKQMLFILSLFLGQVQAQSPAGELKSINGTNLFVKVVGKGEPLLVIHGGPGLNHTYFIPHLESLTENFTLIFYDQRACGRSAVPSTDSLGLRFFIEDIEAIRKQLGYEKISVFAHSWGAILAVGYGISYPARLNSMILCNPVALSHEFDTETAMRQKNAFTRTDSVDRANVIRSDEFKLGKKESYEKLMMISFRHSFYNGKNLSKLRMELPEDFSRANKALYSGLAKYLRQYDYYEACKSFPFLVSIFHGTSDFIPVAASEKLKANIPRSRLEVFQQSGHFVFIEEPQKFKSMVVKGLQNVR